MPLRRSLYLAAQTRAAVSATRLAASRRPADVRFASTAPATVADVSFWKSLVPKPLRRENRDQLKAGKSKEWNPATFFIVMFLFIGSMSIQMIALRNSYDRYIRQADIKIGVLRGVVERIQRGEKVDVERVLGTGDPEKEAEWAEMLRVIERDEASRKSKKQQNPTTPAKYEPSSTPTKEAQHEKPSPPVSKTASLKGFF